MIRPLLRVSIGILASMLVLELSFHLLVAPQLRVAKLVFSGDRPRTDEALGSLLGLRDREYYFSVDETAVEARLVGLPWVRSAKVEKKFPDTLLIELQVRDALALSLVGGAVLAIDEEGWVIEVRTDAQGLDLPVISGVVFETLRAGTRFPDLVLPLFSRMAELRRTSPGLFRLISEIQLRRNDRGGYDAVFCPAHTPVRIVLGDRWDQASIQQMFVLLDLVDQQGWAETTKEIDFRATPVVLRPRES